jgi:hypothetical protein
MHRQSTQPSGWHTGTTYDHGNVIKTDGGNVQWSIDDPRSGINNDRFDPIGNRIETPYRGSGSPEGTVRAPVGSTYRRLDGSTGSSVYIKQSGTGNTGWLPIFGGSAAVSASDTTPAVTAGKMTATAGALSWTITDFDGTLFDGQPLTVLIDNSGSGAVTIEHGSGINLDNAVDWTPGNKGALQLVFDGTDWIESGRSSY